MLDEELLSVYLKDHLAGSRAGVDLARRAAGRNGANRYGRELSEISDAIAEDRLELTRMMDRFGVRPSRIKRPAPTLGCMNLSWNG